MKDPAIIPFLPSVGHYRMSTTLDDEQYVLDVRWNARDGAWYFDILDVEEEPINCGIKIVLGTSLGKKSTHPLFSQAQFRCFDTSGEGRDATFDDLGTRVVVYFFSNAVLLGNA